MGAAAVGIEPIDDIHDFWRWLQHQESRYELVDGRIIAMAGASARHNDIQINLIIAFGTRLRGRPCKVSGPDRLVRTAATGRKGRFPDVTIACDNETSPILTRPVVIVEILSPDSELRDRGEKLHEYKAMPSVMHYVLITQNAVRVEVYSRVEGAWRYDELEGVAATLALDPPGVSVTLAEIYDGVDVGPPAEPGGVPIE